MCDATAVTRHSFEVGIGTTVSLPLGEALQTIERALRNEGFGILTRIDIRETLRDKLGVESPPMVILGACNPQLAHRALLAEPRISLLLPCNVVVRETSPGKTRVEAMNPTVLSDLFPGSDLQEMALEVGRRLRRAIDAFGSPAAS